MNARVVLPAPPLGLAMEIIGIAYPYSFRLRYALNMPFLAQAQAIGGRYAIPMERISIWQSNRNRLAFNRRDRVETALYRERHGELPRASKRLLRTVIHGKLSISQLSKQLPRACLGAGERSEEHTSELQSLMRISYAVFCLQKKNKPTYIQATTKHTQ